MEQNRDIEFERTVCSYKRLFGTPDGVTVLEDLKRKSTITRSSVVDKFSINLNQVLYDEAQRALVLYIDRMINTDLKERLKNE